MKSFIEALKDGGFVTDIEGSWSLKLDDNYEIWFEKLLFDNQYYLAFYKDSDLLFEKIVIIPGK